MTRTMQHLGSLVMLAALLAPVSAFAWNPTGHRVIVSIAYRQLDESTWQKLGALLRNHPAAAQLWTNRALNGPDEVLNLLWNASVFPDEARRPPWDRYNHPKAHYVNYRILSDQGNTVAPPLPDENVLDSYVDHCKAMGGTQTPAAEQCFTSRGSCTRRATSTSLCTRWPDSRRHCRMEIAGATRCTCRIREG